MTTALQGICAAKGVAIGKVYVVDRGQLDVTEYVLRPKEVEPEVERFLQAVEVAREQLRRVRQRIPEDTTADISSFIDTHLLMMDDSALTQVPVELIRNRRCNAEWALKLQRDALVSVFDKMDDPYLRTRKDDVDHVVTRIQRILLKQDRHRYDAADSLLAGSIVLAHDLTPADTVLLQQQGIAGFITEYGGPTSHTAILARSLRIPSVVGLHQARLYLRDDDPVIIDGRAGVVLLEPDTRTIRYYRGLQKLIEKHHQARRKLRNMPARTRDGKDILLQANIELPEDVVAVKRANAAGVGLYRTEFLFMNRDTLPDEEEQFDAYRCVVRELKGGPVTIRTLDIGADKPGGGAARSTGSNPAMGLRAIRLCLKEPALLRPQIRAVLRASYLGSVRLMIPMVSSLQELSQVLQIVEESRRSLREQGLKYDPHMPLGMMLEVPAAALCADLFARHVDFLSIGTNDLIQYTLAIDRVDDEVNYLYDPLHPAVLRLIRMILRAGQKANVSVSMCGEMAGNPRYSRLLLGMGLREFSVPPNTLLEIKQVINGSDAGLLSPLTQRLMRTADTTARTALVDQMNALG